VPAQDRATEAALGIPVIRRQEFQATIEIAEASRLVRKARNLVSNRSRQDET